MSRTRSLTAAIGSFLLLVLSFFGSMPAAAGGDYFEVEVLSFHALGNDEYRIVLRPMTSIYVSDGVRTDPIVIYLRHDEAAMRRAFSEAVSKEEYLAAIDLLMQQIAQSTKIRFGFWGRGVVPIEGKPGEFPSNALTIEEPPFADPAIKRIVFSWSDA